MIEEIPSIVETLRDNYNSGITRPLEYRIGQLRALAKLLTDEKEAMLEALKRDLGKVNQVNSVQARGIIIRVGPYLEWGGQYASRYSEIGRTRDY
jgi:acyl-CoA reductase-like NAD-dependent aldehyde dehydrogenase